MKMKRFTVRTSLTLWLEEQNISPNIIAEIDDSVLMKGFGQAGHGIFSNPTLIDVVAASKQYMP